MKCVVRVCACRTSPPQNVPDSRNASPDGNCVLYAFQTYGDRLGNRE